MPNCPNCHQPIPEISEGKFCPFCGAALSLETPPPANISEPAASPPTGAVDPEPHYAASGAATSGVPWEDRRRLGFLTAFSQTWSDSVLRPTEFFRRTPKTGNLGSALLYAVLIGVAGSMLSLFWTYWFWESSPEMEKLQRLFGEEFNRDMLGVVALLIPVATVIWIFIAAFVYHLCLLITGANKHGFEATLRGFCYSYGPQLLAAIPQCGSLLAFLWQCVLMVIAWREMHESTTGRVVTAVLLPLIFCCGLIILFAFSLAGFLNRISY
jgi:hypothetical protein